LSGIRDQRRPLRVAIAGLGFGLAVHLPSWRLLDGIEVVGVASRRLAKAKDVARQHSVPMASDAVDDLLALRPDVLSAALPPDVAGKAAAAALDNGIAVIGEKPIASELGLAERLAHSARPGITAVNFSFPELLTFRELRRRIAEEDHGSPVEASIVWRTESYAHRNHLWSWKTDRQRFGGVLSSHASHVVHLAEWLFGPTTAVEATLDDSRTRPFTPEGELPAWDEASLVLHHSNGTVCRVSLANAAAGEDTHEWHVRCAEGAFRLVKSGPGIMTNFVLTSQRRGAPPETLARDEHKDAVGGRAMPFRTLLERFVGSVRGGERCSPNFAEGYRAQFLLRRIEDAAGTARKVVL